MGVPRFRKVLAEAAGRFLGRCYREGLLTRAEMAAACACVELNADVS